MLDPVRNILPAAVRLPWRSPAVCATSLIESRGRPRGGAGAEADRQPAAEGKGYHSTDTVLDLKQLGLRSYLSEPARKRRRRWQGWVDTQLAVYGNQRRIRSVRGQRLQRQSSERVERPFAHQARDRRAASDLRPGPRQCAQVTASADMGNQSRSFDTLSDRCRTPRSLQARGVPSIVAPLVGWSAFGRPLKRFRAPLRLHPSICASTIHHQPI